MKRHWLEDLEPERYEIDPLFEERPELLRREFFQLAGGGLLLVCLGRSLEAGQESGSAGRSPEGNAETVQAWLQIDATGQVTVFTGKVEVGQNIRTSLTQAVSDELRIAAGAVQLVMGDTERTPYDGGTFGSRTTPAMAPVLRRAAVAARQWLLEEAAGRWQVDPSTLVAEGGRIREQSGGRSLGYAELAAGRRMVRSLSAAGELTPAGAWRLAGKSHPKISGRDFVTGRHVYTSDLQVPGMGYGKVLRPAAQQARLKSVDCAVAESLPDVAVVQDGSLVGVVADCPEAATEAVRLIKAEWEIPAQPSDREIFDYLRSHPTQSAGWRNREPLVNGSLTEGLQAARHRGRATYTVAYIAHAPLEPRAALARWQGDRLEVWTGTQRPFGVREELAQAFGLPQEKIRVMVPDTGSAYGGKHTGEAAIEAARLARAAGRPVKLVWSREEEFSWAYFRPAGVIDVTSGVDGDGILTAWEFHNYNSGASAIQTPYAVSHRHIEFHPADSPLRQGSYRALAATANVFARESHMDELADRLGIDRLEFRLRNLRDDRLRAVLEAAADRFGWARRLWLPGTGFGIACGVEKGGYIAACAEVAVEAGLERVTVRRLVAAFECGAIVNPLHLESQVEGALVMGLGGALFEAVRFEDGRILNARFSSYRVPRFSDLPEIDVVLVNRPDLPPAGAGETPIVCVAPALAGAIQEASGQRLRSLPLIYHR